MLTKNGRKWIGSALKGGNVSSVKNTDGEILSLTAANISNDLKITIGTGSTLETADDYKMESIVDDQVRMTTWDKTFSDDNYAVQCIAAFNNKSEKAVTIKEIGLYSDYISGVTNYNILVFRKTIDPVKIPAGGTKTFEVILI